MSDNRNDINRGADDRSSADNVICVSFDPDNNAYAALNALKELDSQGQLSLQAAAVVVRDADGHLVVKDQVGFDEFEGAAGGGLLGLLIGIVGGPLGVLIGGTYGLLVGSLIDLDDAEHSESVLGQISAAVHSGETALLAQVTEPSYDVVDTAMSGLGGTVLRRPVAGVEAEIAAAEKAQRDAKREANKELVRSRTEHNKEQVHAKVEQLKAKLPHRDKAPPAS
jgi:uncharacterized membrane protein